VKKKRIEEKGAKFTRVCAAHGRNILKAVILCTVITIYMEWGQERKFPTTQSVYKNIYEIEVTCSH
jgi:hypothetical protein